MAGLRVQDGGKVGAASIGGHRFEMELNQGQVRVPLPFAVSAPRLRDALEREGYRVSPPDPDLPDHLGWGPREDAEGYYPYWMVGARLFAFPPKDYNQTFRAGDVQHSPIIGPRAVEELARFLPLLLEARQENPA